MGEGRGQRSAPSSLAAARMCPIVIHHSWLQGMTFSVGLHNTQAAGCHHMQQLCHDRNHGTSLGVLDTRCCLRRTCGRRAATETATCRGRSASLPAWDASSRSQRVCSSLMLANTLRFGHCPFPSDLDIGLLMVSLQACVVSVCCHHALRCLPRHSSPGSTPSVIVAATGPGTVGCCVPLRLRVSACRCCSYLQDGFHPPSQQKPMQCVACSS